jgi:hypothetical protein
MENETEDKAKEGSLTPSAREAIGDAARANVNAAVEVAKSAVTSFVDVLTRQQKPRRGKRQSTRKKAKSKGAASRRVKSKRSGGGRRSAATTRGEGARKSGRAGKGKKARHTKN